MFHSVPTTHLGTKNGAWGHFPRPVSSMDYLSDLSLWLLGNQPVGAVREFYPTDLSCCDMRNLSPNYS